MRAKSVKTGQAGNSIAVNKVSFELLEWSANEKDNCSLSTTPIGRVHSRYLTYMV
jgi:hypothetical protein